MWKEKLFQRIKININPKLFNMKRLFSFLFALLITFSVQGQGIFEENEKEESIFSSSVDISDIEDEVDVHSYENGVKNLTPDYTIEKDGDQENTYDIYQVENGVRNLTPSYKVEKTNDGTKIYKVTNGIRELTPSFEYD